MLDEKDLQAIAQLMAQQRRDIMQDVKTLLDTEVQTKFNLLAEGQEEILRRMPSEDDMDIIDGRLDTLEAIARKHSREIEELKKAPEKPPPVLPTPGTAHIGVIRFGGLSPLYFNRIGGKVNGEKVSRRKRHNP